MTAAPRVEDASTILVIDDANDVRRMVVRTLQGEGYDVHDAATGPAAIAFVQGHRSPIALVVSDVEMPGLDGPTTVERLRALRPDLRVLFMSGSFYDAEAWRPGRPVELPLRLQKPFELALLLAAVRAALDLPTAPRTESP